MGSKVRHSPEQRAKFVKLVDQYMASGMNNGDACKKAGCSKTGYLVWKGGGYPPRRKQSVSHHTVHIPEASKNVVIARQLLTTAMDLLNAQ